MEKINIITRCTRFDNLMEISNSISHDVGDVGIDIIWYVIFDTKFSKSIDIKIPESISKVSILKFISSEPGSYAYDSINKCLDEIKEGWVYILDDDNILHDKFKERISALIRLYPKKNGIIFSQDVSGRDFSGLDIRRADIDNIKVGKIDVSQFILRRDLIGDFRFVCGYTGDGIFIEEIY